MGGRASLPVERNTDRLEPEGHADEDDVSNAAEIGVLLEPKESRVSIDAEVDGKCRGEDRRVPHREREHVSEGWSALRREAQVAVERGPLVEAQVVTEAGFAGQGASLVERIAHGLEREALERVFQCLLFETHRREELPGGHPPALDELHHLLREGDGHRVVAALSGHVPSTLRAYHETRGEVRAAASSTVSASYCVMGPSRCREA